MKNLINFLISQKNIIFCLSFILLITQPAYSQLKLHGPISNTDMIIVAIILLLPIAAFVLFILSFFRYASEDKKIILIIINLIILFIAIIFPPFMIFPLINIVILWLRNRSRDIFSYAAQGNTEKLQALVFKGEDMNQWDNYYKWTPIFHAVNNGQKETAEFLISVGANINILDINGNSPLDYAKDEDIKQLLISHGAKSSKDLK